MLKLTAPGGRTLCHQMDTSRNIRFPEGEATRGATGKSSISRACRRSISQAGAKVGRQEVERRCAHLGVGDFQMERPAQKLESKQRVGAERAQLVLVDVAQAALQAAA